MAVEKYWRPNRAALASRPNIQIRTSHLDYRPPYPAALAAKMGATPFAADGTENRADGEAGSAVDARATQMPHSILFMGNHY